MLGVSWEMRKTQMVAMAMSGQSDAKQTQQPAEAVVRQAGVPAKKLEAVYSKWRHLEFSTYRNIQEERRDLISCRISLDKISILLVCLLFFWIL